MHSIGVDLLNINRFDKKKNDKTFLNKVFTENELEYIKKRKMNNETMAGIFCAKEAFLKAIKKGINDYSLKDIEVSHNDDNAPFIILYNELKDKYQNNNISLSISHDKDYAVATVLIDFW